VVVQRWLDGRVREQAFDSGVDCGFFQFFLRGGTSPASPRLLLQVPQIQEQVCDVP
jgi:hypothetical protein